MLRLAGDLKAYQLNARDEAIGKAEEFYSVDQSWAVRYLVSWEESRGFINLPREAVQRVPNARKKL